MPVQVDAITHGGHDGWLQTFTGRQFYPGDPRLEDIVLEDIAHALSLSCRFGGHCRAFYSVAQHSVLVSRICPPAVARWALLHDGSEAYLCDIPRPVKQLGAMRPYRELERVIQQLVYDRFGLGGPEPRAVKIADHQALATEHRALFDVPIVEGWFAGAPPVDVVVIPLAPGAAEQVFLTRCQELSIKAQR